MAAARTMALPFFGIGCGTGWRSATGRYAGIGASGKLGAGERIDEGGGERAEGNSEGWSEPCERSDVGGGSEARNVGSWALSMFYLSKRRDISASEVSTSGAVGVMRRWEVA